MKSFTSTKLHGSSCFLSLTPVLESQSTKPCKAPEEAALLHEPRNCDVPGWHIVDQFQTSFL